MSFRTVLIRLFPLLLAAQTAGSQTSIDFASRSIQVKGAVSGVTAMDIDGDSLADLAVSHTLNTLTLRKAHRLTVMFQDRGGAFNRRFSLDPGRDCILWDLADIDLDGRAELLLLKQNGIYFRRISNSGFGAADIQLVREKCLLPGSGGNLPRYPLSLTVQDGVPPLLVMPAWASMNLYRRTGIGYEPGRRLYTPFPAAFTADHDLSYILQLPELQAGRFNRDAHADILCIHGSTLNIFLSLDRRRGSNTDLTVPDLRYLMRSRAISPSVFEQISPEDFRIETVDLNADGYLDVVLSKSPRARFRTGISQVQIFMNRGGRIETLPDQILTADHFSGDHIIADLNRDGLQDIALLTYPLGFTQAARFLLTKRTANSYELFFMRADGSYPAVPDSRIGFTRSVDMENPLDESPLRAMGYDFSGDAVPDFLVAADADCFTVFPGTEECGFTKKGAFSIEAPVDGDLSVTDLNGDRTADLILWKSAAPEATSTITLLLSGGGAAP